MKSDFCWGIGG